MCEKKYDKYYDNDITPCYGRDIANVEEPQNFIEYYKNKKNHPDKDSLSSVDAFEIFNIITNMNKK